MILLSKKWSPFTGRANDASDGLFVERDPSMVAPCKMTVSVAGEQDRVYFGVDHEYWEREVTNAPINRRVWVLQERLCVPRVIHSGLSQILWECNSGVASETWPIFLNHEDGWWPNYREPVFKNKRLIQRPPG